MGEREQQQLRATEAQRFALAHGHALAHTYRDLYAGAHPFTDPFSWPGAHHHTDRNATHALRHTHTFADLYSYTDSYSDRDGDAVR